MQDLAAKTDPKDGYIRAHVPMLIDGKSILRTPDTLKHHVLGGGYFQGAEISDCEEAAASCSRSFAEWSATSPIHRRALLLRLAENLAKREDEATAIIKSEIHCSDDWAAINISDSIRHIKECAYLLTSRTLNGTIPYTDSQGSYGLVFTRPLGVILGIAPWNAPLFLGFRAVIAPVAMGNTVILKGSELSPRTHHFIAEMFGQAGFPPGVVNFILHRPQDAPDIVGHLIGHSAIRKVNFTGSTEVGRSIAQQAGQALKPVLLELGGKNCSIVLRDSDLAQASEAVLTGATLNICMSTDLVLVDESVMDDFRIEIAKSLANRSGMKFRLIGSNSPSRIRALISDATAKGSSVQFSSDLDAESDSPLIPITIFDSVNDSMAYLRTESFGPCIGIVAVSDEADAVKIVNDGGYGLSASIWTRDHYRALNLARKLQVGAVHINSLTVHDEPTLPHGGTGLSGFGRFGAEWGLEEFCETQTVILNH
ncbi:hypothetical protein FIE12Z_5110 [Fusarium flagelliforme]|uniref:Aldehyde dehydrogenase domain-containing protein n=1 Tax=Fusarium flagelliforme TaxID=2675880 RepID=A0A395MSE0_9HYPO|nr:hypothetical protein FIE12Z_5110 [Fusarium flagelliforme]